jgi:large subunit ribosomal protein L15
MSVKPIKPPKGAVKKKKIVGRGDSAGKGSTCGRGDKGQKSRSGGSVRPGFEGGQMPLYRRVARRGFSNYPFKKTYVPLSIAEVEKKFNSGDTVNLASLKEKKLVKNSAQYVKILGKGEVTKKLVIEDLKISKSAKEMVEKAGGTVTEPAAETAEEDGKQETNDDKEGQE